MALVLLYRRKDWTSKKYSTSGSCISLAFGNCHDCFMLIGMWNNSFSGKKNKDPTYGNKVTLKAESWFESLLWESRWVFGTLLENKKLHRESFVSGDLTSCHFAGLWCLLWSFNATKWAVADMTPAHLYLHCQLLDDAVLLWGQCRVSPRGVCSKNRISRSHIAPDLAWIILLDVASRGYVTEVLQMICDFSHVLGNENKTAELRIPPWC